MESLLSVGCWYQVLKECGKNGLIGHKQKDHSQAIRAYRLTILWTILEVNGAEQALNPYLTWLPVIKS